MGDARPAQQTFDFNRAAKLRILEQAEIESRGPAKPVLKAIDSFAREGNEAFPSIKEIARNVGCSPDTARRTVHELRALGLLGIEARRRSNGSHSTNSYSIDWLKLLELAPSSSLFLEQGGTGTVQGGTGTVQVGYSHRASPTHNRPLNRPIKRNHGAPGMKSIQEALPELGKKSQCWGRELTRKDLRTPLTILMLYKLALRRGWLNKFPADDRQRIFFGIAFFCARQGKKPGNYFTDRIKLGRRDQVESEDWTEADRAIRGLELAGHMGPRTETEQEKSERYVQILENLYN